MSGVWFETDRDARAHQCAMDVVPHGLWRAMAVSPLTSRRLDPPDICLIYATPAQMIACADSWGRALATGEPSLSIPCFAERRYGGVMEDELLIALPPKFLPKLINGLAKLSANGLRYPIPQYGIQSDAKAGLEVSYENSKRQ